MANKVNDTKARKMYRIAYRIVRQAMNNNEHTQITPAGQVRQLALIEAHYPKMVERIIETLGEYSQLSRKAPRRDIRLQRELWTIIFEERPEVWEDDNMVYLNILRFWERQIAV